jgi:hypothetical protein
MCQDYIALNGRTIKDVERSGRKRSWPNPVIIPEFFCRLRKITKTLSG